MGLRKPVMAQTPGQRTYLEKLRQDDLGLVFGIGPAGTGKTYLAVAVGAAELKAGKRERLIVARPAVEAGEKLGFLPGALEEKVDPYMLPIWDALNECLGAQEVDRRKERREIEVAPLAFMRGRTLKNAFVIIDEAQNATIPQMKMVLTRLGRGSRMVVTGDPSQTDLPNNMTSGLAHAVSILKGVKGVALEQLTRGGRCASRTRGPDHRRLRQGCLEGVVEGGFAQVSEPLSIDLRIADPRWEALGDVDAFAAHRAGPCLGADADGRGNRGPADGRCRNACSQTSNGGAWTSRPTSCPSPPTNRKFRGNLNTLATWPWGMRRPCVTPRPCTGLLMAISATFSFMASCIS